MLRNKKDIMSDYLNIDNMWKFINEITEEDFLSYLHTCDRLYYGYYIKKISDYIYDMLVEIYETMYKKSYVSRKGIVYYPQRVVKKQLFNNYIQPETAIRIQDNIDGILVGILYLKKENTVEYTIFYGNKIVFGEEAELLLQKINTTDNPFYEENISNKEIFVLGIVPIPILHILQSITYEGGEIIHSLDYCLKNNIKTSTFFAISITYDGNDNTICYDPRVLKFHGFSTPYTIYSDSIRANKNLLSYCHYARYSEAYYNIRGLMIYNETNPSIEPFYKYNNQKITETILVKEVSWKSEKRTNILRPYIHYSIIDRPDNTVYSCVSDAERIITMRIGKGSILLIEKIVVKDMVRKPFDKKLLDTIYILTNLYGSEIQDIYPDKTIYGEYEWNKRKSNFLCKKTEKELLEKKIVVFFNLFNIKNYHFLIDAGLITDNIYKDVTDIFSYNPIQLYYALNKVDIYKLFTLWENIKRKFLKAPLHALMYISGVFNMSEPQLYDILRFYPNFFTTLEKSNDIVKTKTIYKNYCTAFAKKEAFFNFIKSSVPNLLFLDDNTFTIPMKLSLENQTVCFTGFRSKRKENDIQLMKGTYTKDIDIKTTILVNSLPKDATNKKLRYAKKNNIMIVSTYFFNLYFHVHI